LNGLFRMNNADWAALDFTFAYVVYYVCAGLRWESL
jgi:hypothetical protein